MVIGLSTQWSHISTGPGPLGQRSINSKIIADGESRVVAGMTFMRIGDEIYKRIEPSPAQWSCNTTVLVGLCVFWFFAGVVGHNLVY